MENINFKTVGLFTNINQLTAPDGTLSIADNVNIDKANEATSRRGFELLDTSLTTSGHAIKKMHVYADTIFIFTDETTNPIILTRRLLRYTSGAWVEMVFTPTEYNTENPYQCVNYKGSMYISDGGNSGCQKVDNINTQVVLSMGPEPVYTCRLNSVSAGNAISPTSQVAYRAVAKRVDTNGIVQFSAVSERLEVINATGSAEQAVILVGSYGTDSDETIYIQLYRTDNTDDITVVANEEYFLVAEEQLTTGLGGYTEIHITDNVDDNNKGASLYTNPSQQGIEASNERPPYCKDMALYKDFMFFANTKRKNIFVLTILKLNGTDGLQVGDVITLADSGQIQSFTGDATTTNSSLFKVFSTGDQRTDMINTCKDLAFAISSNTTGWLATFLGTDAENNGKIFITSKTGSQTSFSITASAHGSSYEPILPTSGTKIRSDNELKVNRMYYSKRFQPEAVPLLNYFDVGTDDSEIVRAIPLRNSVVIFKDNGEVYRLLGDDPSNFSIDILANGIDLYGARTAQVIDNKIYMMTKQGVGYFTESGFTLVSYPINDQLDDYFSLTNYPDFKSEAFAVAYLSERKYILSYLTKMYVFNHLTKQWTTWDRDAVVGIINPTDDRFYYFNENEHFFKERKDYDEFDYADEQYDVTINSSSEYDVVLNSLTNVAVGQTLYDSDTVYAKITAIDTGTNTVTVDRVLTWPTGAAEVYNPIACSVQWNPIQGSSGNYIKKFPEFTVFFNNISKYFSVFFKNNSTLAETEIELTENLYGDKWGDFTWGDVTWGGDRFAALQKRLYIPHAYMRALWCQLRVYANNAFVDFRLDGIATKYYFIDRRFNDS